MRVSGSMHGADSAAYLGRAVRRAVMSQLGDSAPPEVHGHAGGLHVGWLPLPDVGHPFASGRIIGLGIALPREISTQKRNQILGSLGSLEGVQLPDGRTAKLVFPAPSEKVPIALIERTWTQASKLWATVTPVVLDRPPKRSSEERLCKAMIHSITNAGFPYPEDVSISTHSQFRGSPPAFSVPSPDRKPRFHARVRFGVPVNGPVVAGRLRYFGIGLFRPIPESKGVQAL